MNKQLMQTLTRGGFAKAGTSLTFNTGDWRLKRPEVRPAEPPCGVACPAGENPRDYLAKVAEGDLCAAWETLVGANPLPAITGRVCHYPCESACNRGLYDEAIAIHSVERFLGDRAIAEGWNYPAKPPPSSAPRVAVVGAGPAGLSAAYHLIRCGLLPIVFEAEPEAGGLLRSVLPPYRLPRTVLDRELERLLAIGIAFQSNTRLGRDVSIDELRADFRAVFLAPGAGRPRRWSVDGAAPGDLRSGINLLKEWISIGAIPAYRRVAIVGGGNTAIDLARLMKFGGAGEVHVITFQVLPGPGVSAADAMSAAPREILQALEEGVVIHDRRGIRRLIMRDGAVVGAEIVHMKEMQEPDGRRRLVAFEGTETVLKVEQVIPAVGQEVNATGFEGVLDNAFFAPDRFGRLARHRGIFAGGDARGGGGTVSGAIGDGRRAALAIKAYIEGAEHPHEQVLQPIAYGELNINYFDRAERADPQIVEPAKRSASVEIEGSLTHDCVAFEAGRCFSCGQCMTCDNCWTLCPDNAVLKADGAHWRYVFDYDHCKGCGVCAHECPTGFIAMLSET